MHFKKAYNMTRNKKKILIQTGNEMKTSQQLTMLHIKHQLPIKTVEVDGILHDQLTENGIIYADLNQYEEQKVLRLPYVTGIEPCDD